MQPQSLGMYAWFGHRLPFEQRLALIAPAGFSTTSFWFGDDEELYAGGMADRMPVLARQAGLSLDNIHAPVAECNAFWLESEGSMAAAIKQYEMALAFCRKHDIPMLVVHVCKGSTPPPPTKSGLRAFGELATRAKELGVLLAVENTPSPLHADAVLGAITSDHLGLCYDSSHDFISGHSSCSLLKKWGGRLMTTHLSDNNGTNDDHYLPGDGRIDWDMVQNAFPKTQYSGALMLEVVPRSGDGMTPEQFVRTAFRRALHLREKIGQPSSAGDVAKRAAPEK